MTEAWEQTKEQTVTPKRGNTLEGAKSFPIK